MSVAHGQDMIKFAISVFYYMVLMLHTRIIMLLILCFATSKLNLGCFVDAGPLMTMGNRRQFTSPRREMRWYKRDTEFWETLGTNGAIYWVLQCRVGHSSCRIPCITSLDWRKLLIFSIKQTGPCSCILKL